MRRNRLGMALAACAGLLLAIGAARAETLKIGVIGALTGAGAPWGISTAEAVKILAAEVNGKGGLEVAGKKYQVEVIAYDDQYKAADSVAAYNRLTSQQGVKYILLMSSAATMALKQNIEDDKVIALTSAYASKAIDESSRYLFRLYSPPAEFLPPLVGWLKDNVKERRIVLLNPNDETGWDQARNTERLFKQSGFDVLASELYERSLKDFQPVLTKILGMKPDVIDVGTTSPVTAGLLVRQARELGYKGLFVKTGGPGTREIVDSAGKEAAEGMIAVVYADMANAGYQRIAAAFRKAIGQDANEILVPNYDGAAVLLRAIQLAGDVGDTGKVAAAIPRVLPMRSVQGDEITLGAFGHQFATVLYLGIIKNGEPVIVGKVK